MRSAHDDETRVSVWYIFGVTRIAVIALTSQVIGVEEDLLAQQALELVLQEHRTKQMSVHHPPPERVPIVSPSSGEYPIVVATE